MTDVRENILSRLFEIAQTVNPSAQRMDLNIEIGTTPCLVLLDGEEEFVGDLDKEGQASGKMVLKPHFSLILQTSDLAGPFLSEARTNLVRAVVQDETLRDLTGIIYYGRNKIGAHYLGCETTVHIGEATIAEMVMHFSIAYRFKPLDL